MDSQLVLIEVDPSEWRLDEQTKTVGLRGIEQAREALRAAAAAGIDPSDAQAGEQHRTAA